MDKKNFKIETHCCDECEYYNPVTVECIKNMRYYLDYISHMSNTCIEYKEIKKIKSRNKGL
jgi:hypothetical protein